MKEKENKLFYSSGTKKSNFQNTQCHYPVAYWVCRPMGIVALRGLSHYKVCHIMGFVALWGLLLIGFVALCGLSLIGLFALWGLSLIGFATLWDLSLIELSHYRVCFAYCVCR